MFIASAVSYTLVKIFCPIFKVKEKEIIILQGLAWAPSLRTYGLSDILSKEIFCWVVQKYHSVIWKLEDWKFLTQLPLGPFLDR